MEGARTPCILLCEKVGLQFPLAWGQILAPGWWMGHGQLASLGYWDKDLETGAACAEEKAGFPWAGRRNRGVGWDRGAGNPGGSPGLHTPGHPNGELGPKYQGLLVEVNL